MRNFDETFWLPLKKLDGLEWPLMTFDMGMMLMNCFMTVLTVTCIYFGAEVSANEFICAGKDEILTPSLPRGKN